MNDQRSLRDQLDTLDQLAAKNGLYDAQDWLRATRQAQADLATPTNHAPAPMSNVGKTCVHR